MDEEIRELPGNFCPHRNFTSDCEKCLRFSRGQIIEQEIQEAWQRPEQPIFSAEVIGADGSAKTRFNISRPKKEKWKLWGWSVKQ